MSVCERETAFHQNSRVPTPPYRPIQCFSPCESQKIFETGQEAANLPHLPLFWGRRHPSGLKAAEWKPWGHWGRGATCRMLSNLASQWGQGAEGAGIGKWRMAVLLFLYNKRASL